MTGEERVKAEVMMYAISHDYFGYGSIVKKLSNGQYKVYVDGETYIYSLKQFANEFDDMKIIDRVVIEEACEEYFKSLLKDN